jgi:hypothetical protein
MTPSTDPPIHVTAGADTHRDTHMIAALDQRGAELALLHWPIEGGFVWSETR